MGTVHRPDIFKMVMDLEPYKQDKIGTGEVQVLYPRGYIVKFKKWLDDVTCAPGGTYQGGRKGWLMKHLPPGVHTRGEEKAGRCDM